jgi:hypothetical protein
VACHQSLLHEHLQINVPVQHLLQHQRLTAQDEMSKHVTQTLAMVRKIV